MAIFFLLILANKLVMKNQTDIFPSAHSMKGSHEEREENSSI